MEDSVGYDTERYDAEIRLDRAMIPEYSSVNLAQFFGCHPRTMRKAVASGRIPAPALLGWGNRPHVWTKEQVITMIAEDSYPKTKDNLPHAREHGTVKGAYQHQRRHEPSCEPCRLALYERRQEKSERSRTVR
jgi:hypothetical protein